jgi:hypothetical protein
MTARTEPDLISNFTYDWCPMSVGKPCEAYADNGFYRALSYDTLGRVSQIYSEIDSPTAPYLIDDAFISSAVASAGAGLTLEGLSMVVTIGEDDALLDGLPQSAASRLRCQLNDARRHLLPIWYLH